MHTMVTFVTLVQRFRLFCSTTLAWGRQFINWFRHLNILLFNNMYKTLIVNKFWCNYCDAADKKRYNFALTAWAPLSSVAKFERGWRTLILFDHVIRFKERSIRPTEILRSKFKSMHYLHPISYDNVSLYRYIQYILIMFYKDCM